MNENGQLDHASGSVVSGGVFTIISTPSATTKAEGAGVFAGEVRFTFAGGDAATPGEPPVDIVDPGTVVSVPPFQTVSATATKTKADGSIVMRLGDTNETAQFQGTLGGSPVGPFVGVVEVADAGQTKAKAQ